MPGYAEIGTSAHLEVEERIFKAGHCDNGFCVCSSGVQSDARLGCVVVQVQAGSGSRLSPSVGFATSRAPRVALLCQHQLLGSAHSLDSSECNCGARQVFARCSCRAQCSSKRLLPCNIILAVLQLFVESRPVHAGLSTLPDAQSISQNAAQRPVWSTPSTPRSRYRIIR